jgi:uncharacterized protein (TIGR03435 family)
VRLCAAAAALAVCAFGQSFEVASVKVHTGPIYRMDVVTSGTRLSTEASNLLGLILFAYKLRNYQVVVNSSLVTNDERYEIAAKAEGDRPPTKDEFRRMMQELLADRFKLAFHREQREMQVYGLAVGKNGPKFKESPPDADPMGHISGGRNDTLNLPKATMEDLVGLINGLDHPVVDRTGLTGVYGIKLTYTPENRITRAAEPEDVSIFTAVQEQLGLRLVPQKTEIEILVVDHVEKPSGN